MQDYSEPIATHLQRIDVEAIADMAIAHFKLKPGDNLDGLVSSLGGKIQYSTGESLLNSDSGSLIVHGEKKFEIHLSLNTSLIRDRFTVAHEVGHYVLHFLYQQQANGLEIKNLKAARYGTGEVEWEANWFAAALLMPKERFSDEYNTNSSLVGLSRLFRVSLQAAKIRAKVLGLTPSNDTD
jgi:Zn-dependent peptidase ImmA (M78 family)